MSATPEQIAERLDDVGKWKAIVEKHRRKTDDPSTTYVLKDGTRVHEDESSVAKLAASLSRALEDAATVAAAAAALIRAQAERVRVLEEALNIIAQWDSFSPPLTKNDANIPPEDFPHYVAGRAHAELALIRNYASKSIARAALKAAP